jgi:hypothetical protein
MGSDQDKSNASNWFKDEAPKWQVEQIRFADGTLI